MGVDAGTGCVHSVAETVANVLDLEDAVKPVPTDDGVVYADAGYQGVEKRPDVAGGARLSKVESRVAARKGRHRRDAGAGPPGGVPQGLGAGQGRAPDLFVKHDFGVTRTRYRGLAKNLDLLHVLCASANWLMRARAVGLMGDGRAEACPETVRNPPEGPRTRADPPPRRTPEIVSDA